MKNIVICCDGTWNTPNQNDQGAPTPTNVVRLFNALADVDAKETQQHKYYHPGVGTNGTWWDKMVDGGTGRGLDRNIISAYHDLCRHYESGDNIYLFGFSRGAYTVRSLAGFIGRCGLLDPAANGWSVPETWAHIETLFQEGYRDRKDGVGAGWKRRPAPDNGASIPIHFLGVWDTVGALGIPDDMALLNLIDNLHNHTFHDVNLSSAIRIARHAVALDEPRASFLPTLWNAPEGTDAKEMWFPGCHSDVGGGYRQCGLSDGALLWMIKEAEAAGLAFNQAVIDQIRPDPLDVLHDPCQGVFSLLPTQPRATPQLAPPAGGLHPSVTTRLTTPVIHQGPYRPQRTLVPDAPLTVDVFAGRPWNETGLWLTAGRTYQFAADGEWLDASIVCSPAGVKEGFQFGRIAHLIGDAIGQAEEAFKKLTGNKSAEFRFTRRHEDAPWFCLMGAIANGGKWDAQNNCLTPHETFAIGAGLTCTPKQSGYLYAYANDAWGFYGNNRGSVQLKINQKAEKTEM